MSVKRCLSCGAINHPAPKSHATTTKLKQRIIGRGMSLQNDAAANYLAGAGTALAYMAEEGALERQVVAVAELMGVNFELLDKGDKELLVRAYGKLPG